MSKPNFSENLILHLIVCFCLSGWSRFFSPLPVFICSSFFM